MRYYYSSTRKGSELIPYEGPPEEAYSRVTNPERFLPLQSAAIEMIGRLEETFDVQRLEGYGLDEELEATRGTARPSIRLTPGDSNAAPITVVFTDFPGLFVRLGRWFEDGFPSCGCDACDEDASGEIERLTELVDCVTAGGFRESVRCPRWSLPGDGWREHQFRSAETRRSGRSRLTRSRALQMSGGARRLDLNWQPWPRREP